MMSNRNDNGEESPIKTVLPYWWPILAALSMLLLFMAIASIAEYRVESYVEREFQVMPEDVHRELE